MKAQVTFFPQKHHNKATHFSDKSLVLTCTSHIVSYTLLLEVGLSSIGIINLPADTCMQCMPVGISLHEKCSSAYTSFYPRNYLI